MTREFSEKPWMALVNTGVAPSRVQSAPSCDAPQYLRDLTPRVRRTRVTQLVEAPAAALPAPAAQGHKAKHPDEYSAWKAARNRCTSQANPSWRYYGGLGITFFEGWEGKDGFAAFLAHVGPRPSPKHALARKKKNGNYEPGNVEWRLRRDVKVGVRNDRREYDELEPVRQEEVPKKRNDCTDAVVTERAGLIELGSLRLSANQADELALALVRMAERIRERQRIYDHRNKTPTQGVGA